MTNKAFQKIITDIEAHIMKQAKQNGWMWFYEIHQKEVLNCAKKLLEEYEADKKVVTIACWFHDITKYQVKDKRKDLDKLHKSHHKDGYEFTKRFLKKYEINPEEIEVVAQCVLRHRNSPPYKAITMEERIVAVADVMSHFTSIFYFTHFKFYPDDSIEEMNKKQTQKLQRDWRDLQLLPKSIKIVGNEYKTIERLVKKYNK